MKAMCPSEKTPVKPLESHCEDQIDANRDQDARHIAARNES
jgi:hypothetical protein